MSETLQTLLVKIEATTEQARREIEKLEKGVDRSTRTIETRTKRIDAAFASMGKRMAAAAIAFATAKLTTDLVKTSAALQDINTRYLTLTGTQAEANRELEYASATAERMNSDILTLSDSYAKLIPFVKAGTLSQQEARKVFEGMINAGKALGANNVQLGQSFFGLAQGITSPVLQAQELNQVMEPLPGLLQAMDRALAKSNPELLKTAGSFRNLVKDGEVTSRFFLETLIVALQEFDGAAERTKNNTSAAFTRLGNAWTKLVGALNTPIKGTANAALNSLAYVLDGLAKVAEQMGDQWVIAFSDDANARVSALDDEIKRTEGDLATLSRQMAANPTAARSMEGQVRSLEQRLVRLRAELRATLAVVAREQGGSVTMKMPPAPPAPPSEFPGGSDRKEPLFGHIRPGGSDDRINAWHAWEASVAQSSQRVADTLRRLEFDAKKAMGGIGGAISTDLVYDIELLERELTDLNASQVQIWEATSNLMLERSRTMKEALDNLAEKTDENDVAWNNWLHNVSDGFADAILKAESLGDVLKGLLVQLAKAELSNLFFSALGGQGKTGSIVAVAGKLLGFADGGIPPVGVPSIVGERGPELFVPSTKGRIVPNHALGGQNISVSVNVAPNFAGNAATRQEVLQIAAMTKQAAMDGVAQAIRRGGSYAQAVRGR
jgi:tape measure domain-containing protein